MSPLWASATSLRWVRGPDHAAAHLASRPPRASPPRPRPSSSLQSELGDVVYVELPEVGSEVKKGETFGVVESVKVSPRSHCAGGGGGSTCSAVRPTGPPILSLRCRLPPMCTLPSPARCLRSTLPSWTTLPRCVRGRQGMNCGQGLQAAAARGVPAPPGAGSERAVCTARSGRKLTSAIAISCAWLQYSS